MSGVEVMIREKNPQNQTRQESLLKVVKACGISSKSQETVSFAKVSLTKQFNLIDLSCCDKYH